MAPISSVPQEVTELLLPRDGEPKTFGNWRDQTDPQVFIVEGWSEGLIVGALLIMAIITVANMRKGVLLHKLILLELLLATSHGTFCFMSFDGYGWYLSTTAAMLYTSYFLHNVIAWMKIRPFFTAPHASFSPNVSRTVRWTYLVSLSITAPIVVFQIANNFRFFNNISTLYSLVRPYETLMRDPWWVFSCMTLFHVIRKCYSMNIFLLVQKTPRFGILLASIIISLIFTLMDIISSTTSLSSTDGINPYWKLSLVFKCLTDNIMLDDFKSVLQRLGAIRLGQFKKSPMVRNNLNMEPDAKAGLGSISDLTETAYEHDDIVPAHRFLSNSQRWFNRSQSRNQSQSRNHSRADIRTDSRTDSKPSTSFSAESHRDTLPLSRVSISGRPLGEGEMLDQHGRTRRKLSFSDVAATASKLGEKLKDIQLAHLPFRKNSKQEREARENAKKNLQITVAYPEVSRDSSQREETGVVVQQEWAVESESIGPMEQVRKPLPVAPSSNAPGEHVDFITALMEPEDPPGSTRPRPYGSTELTRGRC